MLAVLWKLLDTRLRDRHDVEQVTKVPLLGEIPRWRGTGSQQVAVRSNPRGARAEAYRRVRSNFEFVRSANKAGVLVVTSAQRAEGKSTTAVNFAWRWPSRARTCSSSTPTCGVPRSRP